MLNKKYFFSILFITSVLNISGFSGGIPQNPFKGGQLYRNWDTHLCWTLYDEHSKVANDVKNDCARNRKDDEYIAYRDKAEKLDQEIKDLAANGLNKMNDKSFMQTAKAQKILTDIANQIINNQFEAGCLIGHSIDMEKVMYKYEKYLIEIFDNRNNPSTVTALGELFKNFKKGTLDRMYFGYLTNIYEQHAQKYPKTMKCHERINDEFQEAKYKYMLFLTSPFDN